MDLDAFWRIVDGARSNASCDEDFLQRIEAHLWELEPDELMEFERQFEKTHTEACSWNLWGAAYLMKGGCSDDGFDYFRAWLMTQGRRTFEKAVKDPDTLAMLPNPERERSRRYRELEEFSTSRARSTRRRPTRKCQNPIPAFFKVWTGALSMYVGISMIPLK